MTSTSDFAGTDRFKIRRRLGSGGMGIVYEAHDRETDRVLALKALTRTEASDIFRFKREFRALADVAHPNLVSLYEFMSDGQFWFFTMELVRGVSFIEYVRPGFRTRSLHHSGFATLIKNDDTDDAPDHEADTVEFDLDQSPTHGKSSSSLAQLPPTLLDESRLRFAIKQLAEGLHGLHETGKLHRDIKPSNVLVTREGRVVVLDFGLVAELGPLGLASTNESVGTPAYAPPEPAAALPVSQAGDWYSVGVMLFEALARRLPFEGRPLEILIAK